MFGNLGPWELVLIFLVVLLVFGAKRIPEIAQGLGKGIREFKKAAKEVGDEVNAQDRLGEAPSRKQEEGDQTPSGDKPSPSSSSQG